MAISISTFLTFSTSIFSLLLSGFVFFKGKDKPANIALSLVSFAVAVWTMGQGMGEIVSGKDAVLLWTRINVGAAVFVPVFYLNFVLALIEKINRQKAVMVLAYASAFVLVILDFTPLFVKDILPVSGFRYYPVGGPAYLVFAVFLAICFIYGFFQLISAMMQRPDRRLRYAFVASLIGFLGGVTALFPVFGINLPVVNQFTLPIYIATTSYAIVKHNLLDINLVLRQGLVYSSLTVFFAVLYALVILVLDRFFQQVAGVNEFAVIFIVICISVLVFQPLKDWIQRVIDKIFFAGSYYYEKTINDLSTENQKLFQSLLRADKLAALGTMSAGMAHEIKNPLASIKGMTQVLPENLEDPEFIKDYVELVPRQLDRINKIVEGLLKVGKIPKLEKRNININNLLNEAADFYLNACLKQEIKVIRDLAELPEIAASHEQLYQVFSNLILNAIQAMPGGGELVISTKRGQDRIQVAIKDSGIGISDDNIDKIFDPFFTLKEKGTGLGLFTAYRIIQSHGGTIEVLSEQGKGTTFKIWLYTKQKE